MYKVDVSIKGTVGLLQNKFSGAELDNLQTGATKVTGKVDYSNEWQEKLYATSDGFLFQPAAHIEGSLVKSAAAFKIKGRGSKTWKDPIRAYVYCVPDEPLLLWEGEPIPEPTSELLTNPTDAIKVDVRRVRVQRAAVARSRLFINEGWELKFTLEIHDTQVGPDVLREILDESGRAVGIGDFRPRYGRFIVILFDVIESTS